MHIEQPYLDLLAEIRNSGEKRTDRTGTGTLSVFGRQMRFDLQQGFPLLTTKRVNFRAIVAELLWFLRGETNVNTLVDGKGSHVGIWDEWADEKGELGPVYGEQWRSWSGRTEYGDSIRVDQIGWVIDEIKRNPDSRRLVVSSWNVCDLPLMNLQPCHVMFQFYVREGRYLDCQLYQRSGDMFLGVPFNIASYALLTMMVAQVTGLEPGVFIHTLGDAHIYLNHLDLVDEQLSRDPVGSPYVWINTYIRSIDDFGFDDIRLHSYMPWGAIKGEVSV